MKPLLPGVFFSLILFAALPVRSQRAESFYVLDSNWQQTTADSAKYLIWVHLKSDSDWAYDYYRMWGPLLKSESFKDHDSKVKDGTSAYYYKNGSLDSVTHYRENRREGTFEKYFPGDTPRLARLYNYGADSLLSQADYTAGGSALQKGTSDPQFYGGDSAWAFFLAKHFQFPDRAGKAHISGSPGVLFTVDVQGSVSDPVIARSVEYSLDREAVRVVRLSPQWMPAMHDGIPVTTKKIITFHLPAR